MTVEIELGREMSELVKGHGDAGVLGKKGTYLVAETAGAAASAVLSGEQPGHWGFNEQRSVSLDVKAEPSGKARTKFSIYRGRGLRFIHGDAEEGAVADEMNMLIDTQAGEIVRSNGHDPLDRNRNSEFDAYCVTPSRFTLPFGGIDDVLRQRQQRSQLVQIGGGTPYFFRLIRCSWGSVSCKAGVTA
jgi:hypothetical protein